MHTANLRPDDIHLKTQGAYIQDFALKASSTTLNSGSEFENDLVEYVGTYGYHRQHAWSLRNTVQRSLCQQLRRFDYSSAKVILTPSTPGRHPFNVPRGYRKLSEAIQKHTRRRDRTQPIICQFSSMGSLTLKWFHEFISAVDVARKECGGPIGSKVKLVYPTVEEVRTSVEGYRGGGSVPGATKNVQKPFLQSCYHRWSSKIPTGHVLHRSGNIPHIKTYYQLSPDHESMDWFVLTSHNMSRAAWGEKQLSRGARRLFIRHWELGVFVAPGRFGQLAVTKLVPPASEHTSDPDSLVVPLPYKLVPDLFQREDKPWTVDGSYSEPDSFGRTSASD